MVLAEDETIGNAQMFPELIARLEGRLEILAKLKKARVNDGDQLGHLFVPGCCLLDAVPHYCHST